MSKVDTDQGMGPGSERQRKELLGLKEERRPVDKTAETEPGIGKVEKRQDESVDQLLEGFGPSRPDLPRILPQIDTTPPPEEAVQKELTPTSPGERQRVRNMVLAMVGSFALIVIVGIVIVKFAGGSSQGVPQTTKPTATAASLATTPSTVVNTASTDVVSTVPTITTMQVDSLPSAKTAVTAHSAHPAGTTSTTAATATTTRPLGSAPPGMNLLPDDPHR